MRKIILLSIALIFSITAFSQDFSNKGKDFWVGYGYHQVMTPGGTGGPQEMVLYFATDTVAFTTITVEIPGTGYTQTYANIPANTVFTSNPIPKIGAQEAKLLVDGLSNKGIHITATAPVVAYAHIYNQNVSGATILFPTPTLGKEYYSINFTNNSNTPNANCWFYVVAVDTGTTTVEITPTATTMGGWPANVTQTVTLTQGQIYNVMGTTVGNSGVDLSGSKIKSIASGNGICKRLAVFSGSGRIFINCGGGGTSSDNYMAQAFPKAAWGKKFLTVPANGNQSFNYYRISVQDPTTVVKINGVVTILPLINNFYYEIAATNQPMLIEGDNPIMVSQYFTSQNACTNGAPGDPEVIYLSPVEQNINKVLWNATGNFNISSQNFNVVIPNTGTALSSFGLFNNATNTPIAIGAWTPHPQASGFSYLRQALPGAGSYRIQSDSGFNAIAYGFGTTESYGYNAGTNIRDLNNRLEIQSTYGIESEPNACTNSPFKFKVYFPDSTLDIIPLPIRFDSMKWEVLPTSTAFTPNNFPVMIYGTVGSPPKVLIDSVNFRNSRQVAWYSLPGLYNVNTPGVYTIRITVYRTNTEGCGNEVEYEFPLTVTDPPTVSFTGPVPGCYLEPLVLTETTPQAPKATYIWYWEVTELPPGPVITTTYSSRNVNLPGHIFTRPGDKRIRHSSITTPGCLSDTIVEFITVPDIPNGSIAGSTSICHNGLPQPDLTVTMIDGRAPYRFTYTINGVPQPPIVSPTGTYNISVPTNTPGTYIYELTEVRNDGSTVCVRPITGQTATVIVRPLPDAAIAGATTVCLNAPQPTVTFTGSNATAPYTFAYNINGVPQTPVVSNAAGVATVTAPTNVVGTFIYEITQVTDGSSNTCNRTITGTTTTIVVQDLPDGIITSSTNAVCLNATQPTVTFTGSVGTAPYIFTYTINGVPQPTIVSNAAGVAIVNVPTTTAGVFVYELTQVQEGSPQACIKAITGQTTSITVNPLPDASIAGAVTVCLNAAQPPVTFTGSNATAPYTFNYTINGVPQTPVISDAAGIAVINAPTNVVGTFIYEITQVTDASSTACIRIITGTTTTIVVQDLPNAVITASTTAACLNSTPLPTVTFTGNTGTAPYTFTYTINGVPQPTIISNGAGVATVNVPTNLATTYTYELTNVSEASAQTCSRVITGQTRVVVINPLPTATVTGGTAVCRDAPPPTVTFTGADATAPYTFDYTINGVPQTPLVSNAAGIATILAPTNIAGTFTYQLTSVRDASSTLCSQLQNGSTVITVNLLPVAAYTFTIPSCANNTINFTNSSTPNAPGVTTWAWNFGDPGSGGANTSNLFSPSHTFVLPGNYTVTLNAINSNGCISNPDAIQNLIINDTPRAGFIVPEVCINDVATVFTDTSSINTGTVNRPLNEWNYGDPPSGPLNNSIGQNGVHLYPAPGVYTVRQIVTSNLGCRDTIYQDITINSADPVSSFLINNNAGLCSSDSVELVNRSTVTFGNVTRLEIYWDDLGTPGVFQTIDIPVFNGIIRHKYPTLQVNRNYQIRMVAYSGNICFAPSQSTITVYATPVVQFNNMPPTCLLVAPFNITQGSETGGVPGTQSYSGPGIINAATGLFDPQLAGVGDHPIKYTWTASNPGACIDTLTRFITVIDTAHATFSYVTPTCDGVAVSFTDLSTAPAGVVLVNTLWDFGHPGPVESHPPGSTFTHMFPGVGNYTVTMRNVSAVGCLSRDTSAVITVAPNHAIALTGGNSIQTVCINRNIIPIVYALSGGATGATVTGLPTGITATVAGTTLTIQGAPTTTVLSPFTFNITTTGNNCIVATATGRITVEPDHTIVLSSANANQSVCVNTPIDDIVYTLGGGAAGVTITNLPPGIIYAVAGNTLTISGTPTTTAGGPLFNFNISTTGNTCLVANALGSIRVNPYPVVTFAPEFPVYCIPIATVKFINGSSMPDGTNMTYAWEFDDPSSGVLNTSSAKDPTHFFATQRIYNIKLVATSQAVLNGNVVGCSKEEIIPLTAIRPQPKAAFSTNKPGVCIGDDVVFRDESDPKDGTTVTRYWDLAGTGTFTSTTNPTITYTYQTIGDYAPSLYIVNSFGCHSDTLPKLFTVNPYPVVNAGADKTILEFGSVRLEPTVTGIDVEYLWTPSLYLDNPRIKNPRASLVRDDITYRLTVTGRGGCPFPDDVNIKVLKFPKIPNTFTPNNDGINDVWRIEYLDSYPNCRVQVFTRTGQLVFESKGYGKPWDGTKKGQPLPFDTYYYVIEPQVGREPVTGYVTIVK